MNTTSATGPAARVPDAPPHPPVTYADEARVAAFVAAHKLGDWVELAIRLARESFRAHGPLRCPWSAGRTTKSTASACGSRR